MSPSRAIFKKNERHQKKSTHCHDSKPRPACKHPLQKVIIKLRVIPEIFRDRKVFRRIPFGVGEPEQESKDCQYIEKDTRHLLERRDAAADQDHGEEEEA